MSAIGAVAHLARNVFLEAAHVVLLYVGGLIVRLVGNRRGVGGDFRVGHDVMHDMLDIDGIYRAMGIEKRDPVKPQFTDHCFTGDYPTPLTDRVGEGGPKQLSLLAEAS